MRHLLKLALLLCWLPANAATLTVMSPYSSTVTTNWSNFISLVGTSTSWTQGTPGSPTFTVSGTGCALASQTVTSATTATVQLTVTSNNCVITDPSTSSTATVTVRAAENWYLRTDGGTRYSTNYVFGQCNGLSNASYVSTGATTNARWVPNTAYALSTVITDYKGNYEKATTGGTSANTTTPPAFPASPSTGTTTSDGSVVWTSEGAFPVNQACAYNALQYYWQDGSTAGQSNYGWIIAGGDTINLEGSIAGSVAYRVGWPTSSGWADPSGFPNFGFNGDATDSGSPDPINFSAQGGFPSGSATTPTRLLGGNVGACTAQSARTQIHGGWGAKNTLNFAGASYIDVECLDVTDYSGCGFSGQSTLCSSSNDWAWYGIVLNNAIHDSTFTDIAMHGFGVAGMYGPVGNNATFTDTQITGNAGAGWNADNATTGLGATLMQNFNISWNGCAEEYPIVDSLPYNQCTDDNSGSHGGSGPGYGDGFGTTTTYTLQNATVGTAFSFQVPSPGGTPPNTYTLQSGSFPPGITMNSSGLISGTPTTSGIYDWNVLVQPSSGGNFSSGYQLAVNSSSVTYAQGWQIKFEQGTSSYNTQDGLDALHTQGVGMTSAFDRILAYSNMGNQIKSGSSNGSAITNSQIFANCEAMSGSIPGTPSGYNSLLTDFCRANNEAVIISTNIGTTSYFVGNTVYAFRTGTSVFNNGDLGGITCTSFSGLYNAGSGPQCDATTNLVYADNVLVGFDPLSTGTFPAQYTLQSGAFATSVFQNAGSIYRNNLHYQLSTTCPDSGETNTICAIPGLNSVSWPTYGTVNVQPTSGSSNVVGAGFNISGITTDFNGVTRPNPQSIGAFEFVNTTLSPVVLFGNGGLKGKGGLQ